MPVPRVLVYLTPGTGQPAVELSLYLSQETAALLTSTIENPTDTNNFTVGDISLKGYDPSGYVQGLLAGIAPLSTDYTIVIQMAMPDGAGGFFGNDVDFSGFVSPSTVQFDPRENSFTFTVIGQARNLQTSSAAGLFNRTADGYFDTKWYLYQDLVPQDGVVRVTSGGGASNNTCDFQAGDTIQVSGAEQFTVVDVKPDTTTQPPAYWELRLYLPATKTYAAGIPSPVNLLTPYARNKSLFSVVRQLFSVIGNGDIRFSSAALPASGALFATPVNVSGLPVGPVSGIAPIGGLLVAGTPQGIYSTTSPTAPFTFFVTKKLAPIDPTNTGTAGGYTGPKRTRTRANAPRYGINVTMKFFAYDSTLYGGTSNRYILTVTVNEDVVNTGATFTGYNFTTKLEWETYNVGTDTWGGTTTLWAGASSTTITDLSAAYDAIGIDVDPASGTILFTDLDVGGAGQQINMNTSSYQPTGANPATGTLSRNRATGVNGPIVFMAPGKVAVFQLDGILGNASQVKTYTVSAAGVMTASVTTPMTPYLIPRSVKYNAGVGLYFGLISDPVTGISIQSWLDWNFSNVFAVAPSNLFPPPPAPAQSPNLLRVPYDLDLVCLPTAGGPGSGLYPMVGLFGGTPYFISNQGSGLIPYVDLSGLSRADALQQLSVINAGIFYVTGSRNLCSFRSRAVPFVGDTIGGSDQIDGDAGFLSLTTRNVFNRWIGYVRIEHETDATIFGEAGSSTFADTNQGLTLKSRFVSSKSFAAALATSLYNYLGQQKRQIEIQRVRDGRIYEVGRTFHCNVDGLNRNFQIIETRHDSTDVTVSVVGLEV